jgi:hypothetical protein
LEEYRLKQYPDWLYQSIIDNTLNWKEAKEYSFQEFSEKYTLHDSYWIGLFYDVAYENNIILAIVWDAVWLPDEIVPSTSIVSEWPLLIIKVEDVLQVSTSGYKDIGCISRGIATAEIEDIDDKHLLVISDHYGGNVEITFSGKLKFLGIDRKGECLPI